MAEGAAEAYHDHAQHEFDLAMQAAEAELVKWRRREEAKWREGLQEREAEITAKLMREWRAKEARREEHLKKQKRRITALESELKGKLAEVERRQKQLQLAEVEFASHKAAVEHQAEREAALRQAERSREEAQLRAKLVSVQMELAAAEERSGFLQERLQAVDALEARHDEQVARAREAHVKASAQAIELQAEADRLKASIVDLRRLKEEAEQEASQLHQQEVAAKRELQEFRREAIAANQERVRDRLREQRQQQLRLQAHYQRACEQASQAQAYNASNVPDPGPPVSDPGRPAAGQRPHAVRSSASNGRVIPARKRGGREVLLVYRRRHRGSELR